jgi:hypothetical protein
LSRFTYDLALYRSIEHGSKGRDSHHKFTSRYVQLSRLRTQRGVHLLRKINIEDLQFRPDKKLLAEMERLQKLELSTLAAWTQDEAINGIYWECPRTTVCLFYSHCLYRLFKCTIRGPQFVCFIPYPVVLSLQIV